MTIQKITHNPTEGHLIIASNGYQQVTSFANSNFNFQSEINENILVENKFMIDSAWETGNVIYIDNGDLKKTSYDGTLLATNSLSTAETLSISQKRILIPEDISQLSDENGCFVIDSTVGGGTLYFADKDLNIIKTKTGLTSIKRVVSCDFDGGCFIFRDDGNIYKLNSNLDVTGSGSYASIIPTVSSASEISSMFSDSLGNLWILYANSIVKVKTTISTPINVLSADINIFPQTDLGYPSSLIKDMDISLADNEIYIIGDNDNKGFIVKYSSEGDVLDINTGLDIPPMSIKVPKVSGNSFYILSDSNGFSTHRTKWWKFDETSGSKWYDSSNRIAYLSPQGVSVVSAMSTVGIVGRAIVTRSYGAYPSAHYASGYSSPAIDFGLTRFSVSFWMNNLNNTANASSRSIITLGSYTNGHKLLITTGYGVLTGHHQIVVSTGVVSATTPQVLVNSTWHFIVVNINGIGQEVEIYVDGVKQVLTGITTMASPYVTSDGYIYLGWRRTHITLSDQDVLDGYIDKFSLWNNPLTQDEITYLAANPDK